MENQVLYANSRVEHGEDDEAVVQALTVCGSFVLPMVLNAAVELDLFEIILKAGDGVCLSASEIASQLPSSSMEGIVVLESMLRCLAANSVLTCEITDLPNGKIGRCYGLAPVGRCFTRDESSGMSLTPYQAFNSGSSKMEYWYNLKDAVLKDQNVFQSDRGKCIYEYTNSNPGDGKMFNDAMAAHSVVIMKRALQVYKGFEGLSSLVNVGGGYGAALDMVVSKYPSIHGVNFDLPQVIESAPPLNGIDHVSGDMFSEVPRGDAIFLKSILHNWSDEQCVVLLKNCYDSLPSKGKLIAMDSILSDLPQNDVHDKYTTQMDVVMAIVFGAKERTRDEFEALATKAGFSQIEVVCYVCGLWVMEFLKH